MTGVPFKVDCVEDLSKHVWTPEAFAEEFGDLRSEIYAFGEKEPHLCSVANFFKGLRHRRTEQGQIAQVGRFPY